MTPIFGDAYSLLTGVIGYDPIAGVALEGWERDLAFLGALPFVPGVAGLAGKAAKSAIGAAADAARSVFGGLGRLGGAVDGVLGRVGDRLRGIGGAIGREAGRVPVGGAAAGAASNGASLTRSDVYAGVREASAYLRSIGVPRHVRRQWLQSFELETITVRRAGDNEFAMRYFGGLDAKRRGATLFSTLPASRASLAIKPEWNTMAEVAQFRIAPGSIVLEGRVAAQGPDLPGGDWQLVLPTWRDDLLEIGR